jgi:hypothetical protein
MCQIVIGSNISVDGFVDSNMRSWNLKDEIVFAKKGICAELILLFDQGED